MRKLEDVLKAKGYSDADLEALKPMLADARFRETLEGSLGELETAAEKFKGEATSWADWYQTTGAPTVDKALQDAQDARAEAAAYQARLKTLQDQGLIKLAELEGEPTQSEPKPAAFDPKAYNLVTAEDVTRFADAEGEAIAMAQDLGAEYHELFGKSLFGYSGQPDANGITSRGMRALRREALASHKPLDIYVREKFNFAGKRAEIEETARKAREDEIRKDERAKAIAEIANPNARPPSASSFTLLPRPNTEGKQPWDSPEDRTHARVNKALTHVLQ
jgi:hypothetical protein